MSSEWGASGKRLIFDVPVEATSDSLVTEREDPMLQRNADKMLPLSSGTYVDDDGGREAEAQE